MVGFFGQIAHLISILPLHFPFFFLREGLRPKWPIEFYYFSEVQRYPYSFLFVINSAYVDFLKESTSTSLMLLKALLKITIELFAPLITLTNRRK